MSDNELIKDRSAELLADDVRKKLTISNIVFLGIAIISVIVSIVGLTSREQEIPHL